MARQKKEKGNGEKTPLIWDIFDIIEVFITCTAAIVVIFSLLVRITIVDGRSMESTLHNGEFLAVSDFLYTPEQGDIVVVHDTSKAGIYSLPIVKRVIATGGQTVNISFDESDNITDVSVDGVSLDESSYAQYIGAPSHPDKDIYPYTLGENEVFVMGDNRNHSGDSRVFGAVHEECIVGKVLLRLFPFDKFGSVYN